ncbi:c-type cytochrome [Nitratireductor luteus]|uniref:c-type cytochrome n=1 Tax=Nitratireductor luteus TaxID=2976980 RepID=UPI00223EE86D|nr:c-type cytochrome [Nitratireductor luteus]
MKRVLAAALPVLLLLAGPTAAQEGDAERGQALFRRQCAACHQVAQPRNGVGPALQNVVGRPAANAEGFSYSPALQESGITWTPGTLDTYLANPAGMVRGTRMMLRVADEQQRRDIIEFLAAQ